tara:strand:- start:109 stop:1560 length:1452 start_codon:yes stop_codon:yes gene_type:complete
MNQSPIRIHPLSRRSFLQGTGLGAAALVGLDERIATAANNSGISTLPHFAPTAKRAICLYQLGGPSQLEMWDHKPHLKEFAGTDLPESVRGNQRLTRMTADQKSLPIAPSMFQFGQAGNSGTWVSSLLPNTAKVVDELCIIRSMHTEAINHDPGTTLVQTGSQQPGLPSMGSWLSYGLGCESQVLPAFVVMISNGSSHRKDVLPLTHRLWGNGFLEPRFQGVKFRSSSDPVLYLSDPANLDGATRRTMTDRIAQLNRLQHAQTGDPETLARIAQYELAFRMQSSVPELASMHDETESTFALYGEKSRQRGTYASNCLMARRMLERGVRFVQLYHRGWDQHDNLPADLARQCGDIDQADSALIFDLKQRGMLDDTLVIWVTEFGRTVYGQGKLNRDQYGRDHHPRCFCVWLSGGGIRGGMTYGQTDDYGYNIVENPVHFRDLHATILHCLGIDHRRMTFPFQGLDQRLTGVEAEAHVLHEILVS